MQRFAFKMKLFPGNRAQYKKRHDEIWPDLVQLLRAAGISDYSIFLDEETHTLFGYLMRKDGHTMDALPLEPVMKKWWSYMKDLMAYDDLGRPVSIPLEEVFHMD